MGACCGPTVDANTRQINRKMSAMSEKDKTTHKLLFLGPGRSGKSTIFRQLQCLHGEGFGKEDCLILRDYVYYQIISQMEDIIRYYDKTQQLTNNDDNELLNAIYTITNNTNHHIMTLELAAAIEYIWKNVDTIKNAFNDPDVSRHQILDESTELFWNDMDRIKDPQYIPNEDDIVKLRYRTTGVIQKQFDITNGNFIIFDVGGQKSERKKWINCFNEVSALIFVISLSCYNELMYEDKNKNCMVDSLQLFDETINSKWFIKTHIILFLNKKDLFQKKIENIPITECPAFDDFERIKQNVIENDPYNYDQTTAYIRRKFRSLNQSDDKEIYTHLTCATDKRNVDKVFADVQLTVIGRGFSSVGLSD